ncbi:MAG: cache domain-containing protein, partial [Anaerotignaceae bacterium]
MKKIKLRIMFVMVTMAVVIAVVLGSVSAYITQRSTKIALEEMIYEAAILGSQSVENKMAIYLRVVEEIAKSPIIADGQSSLDKQKEFLEQRVAAYGMKSAGIIYPNGRDIVSAKDCSGYRFYQQAALGNTYLSAPYINETRTEATIYVATPIDDGTNKKILYFACDNDILQQMVKDAVVGNMGDAYIVDSEGRTIAYPDESLVLSESNAIQDAISAPD